MVLGFEWVSGDHATVDYRDGKLFLLDRGSSIGTALHPKGDPIQPYVPVNLGHHGNEFVIGNLLISVSLTEVPDDSQRSQITGKPLRTRRVDALDALARNLEKNAPVAEIIQRYFSIDQELEKLINDIAEQTTAHPVVARERLAAIVQSCPGLNHVQKFQRLAATHGLSLGPSHAVLLAAYDAICDLADFFVAKPVETVEDIVAFKQRLQDANHEFIEKFVRLREVVRRFGADFDAPSSSGSDSSWAVDAEQVARHLFDWTKAGDGAGSLGAAFEGFMLHQLAFFNGVMNGIPSLLRELSPATIERAVPGSAWWPFRPAALWKTFQRIHADFTSEESERFRVIFGVEFWREYWRYWKDYRQTFAAGLQLQSQPVVPEPPAVVGYPAPPAPPPQGGPPQHPVAGPTTTVAMPPQPPAHNPKHQG